MTAKTARGAVTAPSQALGASGPQKSSVLKSAFSPSIFQLHLFASVIQGFDSQHLRIQDTKTSRLRCDHAAGPGTRITSLDWGYYGTSYREPSKKKRKRGEEQERNTAGNAVVAYGTSSSEICMFSPAEAKVVGKLSGSHDRGIKDFRFAGEDFAEGWSLGGDGKLVHWDLKTQKPIRHITLPDPSINTLSPSNLSHSGHRISTPEKGSPHLLCASTTPYTLTLTSTDHSFESFDAFKNPVHSILRSYAASRIGTDSFLASDGDRYINLYDISQKKLARTLVAGSGVEDVAMSSNDLQEANSTQILAVTTSSGLVELFVEPFAMPQQSSHSDNSIKSRRKDLTRKCTAWIKIRKPDSKASVVPVFKASVQGPDIVVAWADGGVDVSFQRVRWQDEGNGDLLFDGQKEVIRTKSASALSSATMNGVKDIGNVHVDESRTVVADNGAQPSSQTLAIDISSDDEAVHGEAMSEEEEEEEADDEEEEEERSDAEDTEATHVTSGQADKQLDTEMADAADDAEAVRGIIGNQLEDENEQGEEPSFGEILASRNPEMISVADALVPVVSSTANEPHKGTLALPSGMSLSVVLSQALRTNDQNLLESCLHTTSVDTIRGTIQRLDSALAGVLLQKLAERLSSRPGRYGKLSDWVQWTCIVHGGAIMGRPDVLPKIKTLYQVLSQRSKCMDPLLLLKGKLDMLHAQMELRKHSRTERGPSRQGPDEEGIIYVEGQDDDFSSDEDEAAGAPPAAIKAAAPKKLLQDLISEGESEESDEDMPLTNGILHSSDEGSGAASDEDDAGAEADADETDGLIDDEAIESGDDSHPSDREESEEDDDDDDDDEADSEMDDFIDDEPISDVEVGSEVSIDDTPEKPPAKKSRR